MNEKKFVVGGIVASAIIYYYYETSKTKKPEISKTEEPQILETEEPQIPETEEPQIPETEEPQIPETKEPQIPETKDSVHRITSKLPKPQPTTIVGWLAPLIFSIIVARYGYNVRHYDESSIFADEDFYEDFDLREEDQEFNLRKYVSYRMKKRRFEDLEEI